MLIDKYPDSNLYHQSFYSSLIAMIEEEEWEKVKSIGYEYIENNINGSFISEITLNLMMLHMQLNEFKSAKLDKLQLTKFPIINLKIKYFICWVIYISLKWNMKLH